MSFHTLDPRRLLTFAALPLSLLVGFALAQAPALAAGGVIGVIALVAIVRQPELGALTILVLVALVPRSVLFEQGVPLAGGNLKVTDVLLVATMGSWLAARTTNPARYPLPTRPTTILIATFLFLAVVSVFTAHSMGTASKFSLLELRPLLSYLLIFPLVSGARNWKELRVGILLLLGAASVSAGVSIFDYASGIGTVGTFAGGALRVDAATYSPALIAAVWAIAFLAYAQTRRLRSASLCLAAVALTGLFFTFSRGAWLALLAGVFLIVVLLSARRRITVLGWLLPLVVVAAVSVMSFNALSAQQVANPLSAGLDRLRSVGQLQNDVSSRYRAAEWSTAIHEVERHPITGIGLGSSVTFTNPMFSPSSNGYGFTFSTYYIHNSYIWFALKIGVVGALVFFGLIAKICWMALEGCRRANDPREKMVLLACLGSLFAVLVLSVSGPHLNVDNATPAVAALIAAVEIARRLGISDTDEAT